MSILYQSNDTDSPSKPVGWNTMPAVVVSASSGLTFGLPPEKLAVEIDAPPLSGSLTVTPPRVWSKRSRSVAARTSRDCVARNRTASVTCQLKPTLPAQISPLPE